MPGTSHTMELRIFDGVALQMIDPIREVLNNYTLAEMIQCLDEGPSRTLMEKYPALNLNAWDQLFRKVCFSKVTYVELNQRFDPEYIYFLFNLLADCLNCHIDPKGEQLLKCIPEDYRHTREWITKAKIVLRSQNNQK